MPGPPPPPPMVPAAAPPPPLFSTPKGSNDRGALLKSIRQGTKLKKTVTVDKSAPVISGKVNSVSNSTSNNSALNSTSNTNSSNGLPLGGLFAGGMPKLKPTGRLGSSSTLNSTSTNMNNNNNNIETGGGSPKVHQPSRNFSSVQDQLKRQLTSPSDTRTRGPPPPAPARNMSVDETKNVKSLGLTNHSANGLHLSHTSLQPNASTLHLQSGRKSKSNVNLVALDSTDSGGAGGVNISAFHASKPVISHGKPNLAPKPPTANGKPGTPLKLSIIPNKPISRAQSMRSPRTPSPQTPNLADTSIKFGTVRNISTLLGPTINAQGGQVTNRQRPGLAMRPSVPPPSVPAPAAPSKISVVKPPNHAPPPPPGTPQPPSAAPPPPPPNKTQQTTMAQPVRPPPAIPNSNHNSGNNPPPPPPPPRGSSMRDTNQTRRRSFTDFDAKFQDQFATPDEFPRPPPFRKVVKLYSNSQATNKQQAPLPPRLQAPGRVWNSTSTC